MPGKIGLKSEEMMGKQTMTHNNEFQVTLADGTVLVAVPADTLFGLACF